MNQEFCCQKDHVTIAAQSSNQKEIGTGSTNRNAAAAIGRTWQMKMWFSGTALTRLNQNLE